MILRVGIDHAGGILMRHARDRGHPVMLSANTLWNGKWRKPPFKDMDGVDVALDSSGFVAMTHFGGYRWTPTEYLEIAAAFPWAWWASMDFCCEPEIASNRAEVESRIQRTIATYKELLIGARDAGIPPPMPVLQGWLPEDYLRCAVAMPDWPELVGIGSVCRRETSAIIHLIDVLDKFLPGHVKFHLFGVKGDALPMLAGHPRVFSTDSMAWDLAMRLETQPPRPRSMRAEYMSKWFDDQTEKINAATPSWQPSLGFEGV